MANIHDVKALAQDLHDRKIVNLDSKVSDLLAAQVPVHLTDKGAEAGWYVVGGEHYVIVCGKNGVTAVDPAAARVVKTDVVR